jgi:hypothetical protein
MRRTIIAVAVVLFGVHAQAGVMTQTANFDFRSHATVTGFYNQLNPSLAPLNHVLITVTYSLGSVFDSFQFTNPTSNTISFNATLSGNIELDGCFFGTRSTVPVTLFPFQSQLLALSIPAGSQSSNVETTGLDQYVGTGMLAPFGTAMDFGTPDNPLIGVTNLDAFEFRGTETVTYFYGSTFLAPAPPSLVMLSVGLIVIGGLAWRLRKAKVVA